MAGRDDEALSWDGDDDPTLDVVPAAPTEVAPASLPAGWSAVGKGSDAVSSTIADAPDVESGMVDAGDADTAGPKPIGNAALIATGVLGGIYLLFAVGWLIGGSRLQGVRTYLVTDVMYQGSLWLATLAPLIWFATVWLVTRGSAPWVRYVWLVLGMVLLVPWPFVMIGAVGQ